MVIQKHSKKKQNKSKSYIKPGNPLNEQEFDSMVKESEESGYLTLEEFKKKFLALGTLK